MRLYKGGHMALLMLLALLLTAMAGSCTDEKEKMLIPQGEMADLLYDYHKAAAMVEAQNLDSVEAQKYLMSIMEKYGVTQAQIDTSMVYYMRHADLMTDIYKQLTERIDNEARLEGADEDMAMVAVSSLSGDTANIWTHEKGKLLMQAAPYNMLKFTYKADSTYKEGDRFLLGMKNDFLMQDGSRNGLALMYLRLKNDSVICRTQNLNATKKYQIECSDADRIGIKELGGFIMLRNASLGEKTNSSTIRYMIVTDLQLLRIHTKPKPSAEELKSKADSLNADTVKSKAEVAPNTPAPTITSKKVPLPKR